MRSLFILLLLSIYSLSYGQQPEQDTLSQTQQVDSESTLTSDIDEEPADKKLRPFKGPLSMFSGNPGRAALYSLAVPGAGQFYNKRYWKIPVFLAFEGIAIGVLVNNSREFKFWDNGLRQIIADPSVTLFQGRNIQEVRSIRDSARANRSYAIIGVAAVHLLQVADAFVNRHLIEFDVSDNLSLNLGTNDIGPSLSLAFKY